MIPTVTLNNGVEMQMLGFGTSQLSNSGDAERAVADALSSGYRLIDTAKKYGNEESVGRAVRSSGIPRSGLFITTKLWPADFSDPKGAFHASLGRLGLDYVDLYLIHWPASPTPRSVWEALEELYEAKFIRAIGVSNYDIGEMDALLSYATIVPAVNQVKCNPFDYPKDVIEYDHGKHVVVEGYSPLTRGSNLNDRTVAAIAKEYGRSPAQVMIRWCVEHNVVPIPKSSHPERMRGNMRVFDFELSAEDMRTLDELG